MTDRAFLDTNILVYLFDSRAPAKQRLAGNLVQRLASEQAVRVISAQVLQEAYSALTRKLDFDGAETQSVLQMMVDSGFIVESLDVPLIWRGAARSINDKLSFWDGLIVESARTAQCTVLYTEDLQNGRTFDGLTVRNPFA
jgi:predicted nucleic acid-binding protein